MNNTIEFNLNDEVIMKKPHACGTNSWTITRNGADIKIKCNNCGREIMMDRLEFMRKLKKVIKNEKTSNKRKNWLTSRDDAAYTLFCSNHLKWNFKFL